MRQRAGEARAGAAGQRRGCLCRGVKCSPVQKLVVVHRAVRPVEESVLSCASEDAHGQRTPRGWVARWRAAVV